MSCCTLRISRYRRSRSTPCRTTFTFAAFDFSTSRATKRPITLRKPKQKFASLVPNDGVLSTVLQSNNRHNWLLFQQIGQMKFDMGTGRNHGEWFKQICHVAFMCSLLIAGLWAALVQGELVDIKVQRWFSAYSNIPRAHTTAEETRHLGHESTPVHTDVTSVSETRRHRLDVNLDCDNKRRRDAL